ncbi:hypothetical protein [Streptococcus orisasini]|uniref:hypothetical protein n=1 Tax=Streptococcus orisasini TaxID=1080071 RepID=UPI0007102651|nr:hypothetical protein [Streptococcus orisasini]
MGLQDLLGNIADSISVSLDQQNRDLQIKKLKKANQRLKFERDNAIDLNNKKDDFVKSLAGRLLQKGDPEGGRLLSDYKKYKNSK